TYQKQAITQFKLQSQNKPNGQYSLPASLLAKCQSFGIFRAILLLRKYLRGTYLLLLKKAPLLSEMQ
ncbi:hypothetical protein ACUT1Y_001644, partial [Shigella sonnei]